MIAWGGLKLLPEGHVARWRGREFALSAFEIRFLTLLIEAKGGYVPRATVEALVGGNANRMNVRLAYLRDKAPDRLATLFEYRKGFGFRLCGGDAAAAESAATARIEAQRAAAVRARRASPLRTVKHIRPIAPRAVLLRDPAAPPVDGEDPRRQLRVDVPEAVSATLRAAAPLTGQSPQGLAVVLIDEALDARYRGVRPVEPLRFADLPVDLSSSIARQAAAAGVPLARFVAEVASMGLETWRDAYAHGEIGGAA